MPPSTPSPTVTPKMHHMILLLDLVLGSLCLSRCPTFLRDPGRQYDRVFFMRISHPLPSQPRTMGAQDASEAADTPPHLFENHKVILHRSPLVGLLFIPARKKQRDAELRADVLPPSTTSLKKPLLPVDAPKQDTQPACVSILPVRKCLSHPSYVLSFLSAHVPLMT